MTRMTGPDCVVMCNLINTYIHTYIHTYSLGEESEPKSSRVTIFSGANGDRGKTVCKEEYECI